jgi:asparaginyl-tRNA synthetase
MRARNALSFGVHEYFQKHGFLNIHTPLITSNDCEGGGELFRVEAHSTIAHALEKKTGLAPADEFFGHPTFLTVSGQLHAEMFAMALSKVYTFGPTFRAEVSLACSDQCRPLPFNGIFLR